MKIYLKNASIVLIVFLLMFSLTGCNNKDNEKNMLSEKVKEELEYLDLEIVSLINSLNNITIENYKVTTKEVNLR